MRAVTFDTLEYMDDLRKSGVNDQQAEAIVKGTSRAFSQMMEYQQLASKSDLTNLKIELQAFIIKVISTAILVLTGCQAVFHIIGR